MKALLRTGWRRYALHTSGTNTLHSGIYPCEHCADNSVSTHGNRLSPQNHHQFKPPAPIRWRLIAASH